MANFKDGTLKELESMGYSVGLWEDFWNDREADPKSAKEATITNWDEGVICKTIRLPKKKEIDTDWILGKVSDVSVFINLRDRLKDQPFITGFNVYATSYGIGVMSIYNRERNEEIKEVENFLDTHGITYTNEYSDAKWVYRFKISKAKDNIEKLKLI